MAGRRRHRRKSLAVLRESMDMRLSSKTVRQAIKVSREDDWSELTKRAEVNPWMLVKLEEWLSPGEAGPTTSPGALCRRALSS